MALKLLLSERGASQQPLSMGAARLDTANPLAHKLDYVGLTTDSGTLVFTGGRRVAAATDVARSRAGRAGLGATNISIGGTTPILQTGQTGITGTDYTLFALATLPSGSGVKMALDDDLDTSSPRVFQFRVYLSKVELITFDTSGNPYFAAASGTLSTAEFNAGFTMGAVVKGNSLAVFQNNVKTTGTASGTQRQPSGNFFVGQHKGTGGAGWDGELVLTAAWSRALSDAEMALLHANPWQLFLDEQYLPVLASAAASPSRRWYFDMIGQSRMGS